jgi:hypothetical protein
MEYENEEKIQEEIEVTSGKDVEMEESEGNNTTEKEENINNGKKESKAFKKLLEELKIPENEEVMEESNEQKRQGVIEKMKKAVRGERKAIRYWYECGEEFCKEFEGKRNKVQREIKVKIYKEAVRQMPGFSRGSIMKELKRAERVYKLFREIEKEKITRLKECRMNTINNCRDWEIQKIREYFRNERV